MSENSQGQVGESWSRIAAELRAVQEDQKDLFAGLSDELLDRYLSGKATKSDKEQVQKAVEGDPELREALDALTWALSEPTDLPGEIPAVPSPLFAGRINCGKEPDEPPEKKIKTKDQVTITITPELLAQLEEQKKKTKDPLLASRISEAIEQPKPVRLR